MDAWIKILVVMILMSALSMVIGIVVLNPFYGLILVGIILTLMVLTVEPATGKAMAQVTIPIVIVLFVFQLIYVGAAFVFDPIMIFIAGAFLYILFSVFTGGATGIEGGIIDAKLSLKLFPIYGVAIFVAWFIDPTGHMPVYIMVGTILSLMGLYIVFLRDYDKWPQYEYAKMRNIVAITDINPKGKVKSGAEIWWAKTTGPPIYEGETVNVLGLSGMTMVVTKGIGSEIASDQ
ncbi:MAG: NfeD family protein [Candidatus Thorarchaeota archaeon]